MNTKQKVIEKAWLKYGIPYSTEYIDEDGYMIRKAFVDESIDVIRIKIEKRCDGFKDFEFKSRWGDYRPSELNGIENNNGWFRFEEHKLQTGKYFHIAFKNPYGDEYTYMGVREYKSGFFDDAGYWLTPYPTHVIPVGEPHAPFY